MTGDRLRQLADAVETEVTPGDPIWLVSDDDIEVWAHSADARLIAALGPDAARLLADAMDALEGVRDWIRYGEGSEADAAEKMGDVLARFAALGEGQDSAERPESVCGRCGGFNPVWVAPSPLWNQVMRGGDINGIEVCSIVCPSCFAALAADVAAGWRFYATDVKADLQTVTPSGRVWNEETWMFDEPGEGQDSAERCPVFGEARSASDCEVCGGDIVNCPIYGPTERARLAKVGECPCDGDRGCVCQ